MKNPNNCSADEIVEMVTRSLEQFEMSGFPPNIVLSYFGNGFSRVSLGMGFPKEEFRQLVNEVADLYDREIDNMKNE
jgi:hypothetical protein